MSMVLVFIKSYFVTHRHLMPCDSFLQQEGAVITRNFSDTLCKGGLATDPTPATQGPHYGPLAC